MPKLILTGEDIAAYMNADPQLDNEDIQDLCMMLADVLNGTLSIKKLRRDIECVVLRRKH